jgi:hypothetical protein
VQPRCLLARSDVPLSVRIRAAAAALPFEHPKLAVLATLRLTEGLAERLEAAIARVAQARVIDGEAVEVPPNNPQNPPVRLPVAPTKGPGFRRRI